jgi:penicillin amidase
LPERTQLKRSWQRYALQPPPRVWYENHLVADGVDVTGVTFPGLPGIVAGHNGKVAWGYTNGFPDVQDLYIERIRRSEDGGVQAEYNGTWEAARVLHETIAVKEEEPVVKRSSSRHGPVINNLAAGFAVKKRLHYAGHRLSLTLVHALFGDESAQLFRVSEP